MPSDCFSKRFLQAAPHVTCSIKDACLSDKSLKAEAVWCKSPSKRRSTILYKAVQVILHSILT